ncbi:MAG: YihY/virulence factor BrkB family protein [Acidimicrobiia bacterium]|nr:YihY/virulence factor BrkB family protein [Acidimicrobiia bacterium]
MSRRPRSVTRELVDEFGADRVTGLSAEVAFWWVFTLFPALLILAAVLGLLDSIVGRGASHRDVESQIVDVIAEFTGSSENQLVEQVQQLFRDQATGVLTFGALLALWSTSRSFTALISALDRVYDLDDPRSYVRVRGLGLLLAVGALVAGALVLTLVIVGPLFGRGDDIAELLGIGGDTFALAWNWLRLPAAAAALVLFHATIYHFAPNHHTPWRWDLPGALTATVFWGVASLGFRIYLSISGDSSLVLGVLGGALTLMLWLYLLAIGMLVGGEVNAILVHRRDLVAPPRTEHLWRRLRRWRRERFAGDADTAGTGEAGLPVDAVADTGARPARDDEARPRGR